MGTLLEWFRAGALARSHAQQILELLLTSGGLLSFAAALVNFAREALARRDERLKRDERRKRRARRRQRQNRKL
jgi:hypothetical protein